MKPSSILALVFAFGLGLFAAGCTASSQLDEGTETQPAPAKTPAPVTPAVVKTTPPVQTNRQGFTTKEDTIEVESAQKNRRPEHTPVVVQRRAPVVKTTYGVQIGAFKEEKNAQRATGTLAKRYKKPAAFFFDEGLKIFKVTIGNFATEQEAKQFAAAMKKKYPKEYKNVWVIRRPE
jgi:cell division septation protein DedD